MKNFRRKRSMLLALGLLVAALAWLGSGVGTS